MRTPSTRNVRSNGKSNLQRLARSQLDNGGTGKHKVSQVKRRRRRRIVYCAAALFGLTWIYTLVRSSKSRVGTSYLRDGLDRAQRLHYALSRVGHSHDETHYHPRKPFTNSNRYLDPRQLATLPGKEPDEYDGGDNNTRPWGEGDDEWRSTAKHNVRKDLGPKVDYTKYTYEYPKIVTEPPTDGSYPILEPMMDVFHTWGQDDLDAPPDTIVEVLQHFDYQSDWQMEVRMELRYAFVTSKAHGLKSFLLLLI